MCPVPHGTVSTLAIENAMGWSTPAGANTGYAGPPTEVARLVRNLVLGAEFLMSHITHFYVLAALDLVQGPGMAPWTPYWDTSYYDSLLQASVGLSWTSGVPNNIYTAVITDYVLSLTARRKATDAGAIFAGRTPIHSSYVAGGVTNVPTSGMINTYKGLMTDVKSFIDTHYVPLTEVVSVLHGLADNDQNNWWGIASGLPGTRGPYSVTAGQQTGVNLGAGCKNFLAWGGFETATGAPYVPDNTKRLMKRGAIVGATNLASGTWEDINPADVFEYITNAHYLATDDTKNPYDNVTHPDTSRGYTWHKSPRYLTGLSANPTSVPATAVKEVGPLARMWISGNYNPNATPTINCSNHAFSVIPQLGTLSVTYKPGISVMDRHRARAREAQLIATEMTKVGGWLDQLQAALGTASYDGTKTIPANGQGIGLYEAPRGGVAHWVKYKNGKVDNYAVIAPTTWNGSGRDISGNAGPIEQALNGIPIRAVKSGTASIPVEALIVTHSFDPCIACSIHVVEPKKSAKKKLSKFEVEGGCEK